MPTLCLPVEWGGFGRGLKKDHIGSLATKIGASTPSEIGKRKVGKFTSWWSLRPKISKWCNFGVAIVAQTFEVLTTVWPWLSPTCSSSLLVDGAEVLR